MILSKRLKEIASLIPFHKNVIDIGCDHGMLDIFLAQTRADIEVLGVDISPYSIASAIERAKPYHLANLSFKVNNGLAGLSLQNEVLVLSGLGTFTILEILESVSLQNHMLVISAQKNVDFLRREMVKKGYYIRDEKAVFDRKWYVIMIFVKGEKIYTDEDYLIGPFAKKNEAYIEYLYEKEKKISQKKGIATPLFLSLSKKRKHQ